MVRSAAPTVVVMAMRSRRDRFDGQHLLGALEIGDVDLVGNFRHGIGDFLALRLRPVQDGHTGAYVAPQRFALPNLDAPPTHDAISIWLPFQKVLDL